MISFLVALIASPLLIFAANSFAGNMLPCVSEFYPSAKQHCRLDVRHIEGSGIGYNKGYTTFEGFFATSPNQDQFMPFLDLRGHVFNNGKFASNVGLGFRKSTDCHVFGLNTYYDYRKTKQINYNQIGFGAEALGLKWDLRVNGYLPVGKKSVQLGETAFAGFAGHNLLVLQNQQFAMKGFNAELGYHLNRPTCGDFYFAVGPYHFTQANDPKVWGGKARLVYRYKDYVTLELSDSYDNYFHNKFQCQLTLSLPLGREPEVDSQSYQPCRANKAILSRMVQPVDRQEIVVQADKKQNVAAINPATGAPFYFVFVNNTSHSQGTYESPYPTLIQAQANSKPNDVIYVYPGDGTTTGMDAGITLQLNQKFWGSGTSHALSTLQGNVIIPAQTSTNPTITNIPLDGNAITLAAINKISGFTITGAGGNGIFGTNLENIEIENCTISNSFADHIHLEYSSANSSTVLDQLTLTNCQLDAIYIDSTSNTNTCTINACTITGSDVYTVNGTFANQAIFNLTNNNLDSNVNNCIINFNGPGTLTASNNVFSNTTSVSSPPLIVTTGTSPLLATITNNTFSDNTCSAINLILNDNSLATLNITNNFFYRNNTGSVGTGFGSAIFINPNNTTLSNCQLNLANNQFTDNASNSLYCANGSYNSFNITATDNNSTNNHGGGYVFASDTNSFTLNASNNTIANGQDNGIATIGLMTTANINISNNQITGNAGGANGISISHSGTTLDLTVNNNNISNNDSTGILMYSSPGIDNVILEINDNLINNNQNTGTNAAGGIDLEQYINLSGSITNNTLAGNTNYDLYVGSTLTTPTVCLNLSGNTSQTDYALANNAGTFNLAPCNVDSVNIGTINTFGDPITPVQSCPGAAACSP